MGEEGGRAWPSVDFSVAGVDTSTAPVASLLGVCERPGTDQFDDGIHARYYRGSIRAVNGTLGENRTVNLVPLDRYVQGVVPREMPAAWGGDGGGAGMHALRAQAVAARSYGLAQTRYSYARTCDTQSCQVYGGAGYRAAVNAEDGGPTPIVGNESPFANQATTDTAGVVLVAHGAVVSTMYSASSGGYTNDAGAFPAVPDEGDQYSPLPDRHNWTTTLSVATIEAAYPQIGTLQLLRIAARNGLGEDGGRVRSMEIVGTARLGDRHRCPVPRPVRTAVGLVLGADGVRRPGGAAGRGPRAGRAGPVRAGDAGAPARHPRRHRHRRRAARRRLLDGAAGRGRRRRPGDGCRGRRPERHGHAGRRARLPDRVPVR